MRTGHLLLVASLLLSACSSGSDDPLADKCKSVCNISDSHPCYDNGKGEEECEKACRNLAGSVDRNPDYMSGCAECVASQFKYAIKTDPGCSETSGGIDCCFPGYVIQPKVGDDTNDGWKACMPVCVEPDGGIGY